MHCERRTSFSCSFNLVGRGIIAQVGSCGKPHLLLWHSVHYKQIILGCQL
jgi:hypothetical protein